LFLEERLIFAHPVALQGGAVALAEVGHRQGEEALAGESGLG